MKQSQVNCTQKIESDLASKEQKQDDFSKSIITEVLERHYISAKIKFIYTARVI